MANAPTPLNACDLLTFSDITPAKWEAIKLQLQKFGAPQDIPDNGDASAQGFTFTWNYVEKTQTLDIQCLESPMWISCDEIKNGIIETIDSV